MTTTERTTTMASDDRLRRWARLAWARAGSLAATLALLGGLAGLAAAGGYLLAGRWGALLAVIAASLSTLGGARMADRYVLRSVRARPLGAHEAPFVWRTVRALAERAGVPAPRLWVFPADAPNAFTVGRDPASASVALSTGLLRRLDARGLAGVLAHEIAHVRHRDILLTSFATTVTAMLSSVRRVLGALVALAFPLLLLFEPRALALWAVFAVAPVAALLLQAALSRQREFAADREAARLTGDPAGLAVALRRIEAASRSWLAALLGRGVRTGVPSPWSSHPPTDERVARLRALGRPASPTASTGGAVEAGARPSRGRVVPVRVYRGHRPVARRGHFGVRLVG